MEVPTETPAGAGAAPSVSTAGAYELFWDSIENESSAGDDLNGTSEVMDAYGQFWRQVDD